MIKRLPTLLLITLIFTLVISPKILEANGKWLITPEEIQQIQRRGSPLKQPLSIREGPGPAIVLENPKMLESVKSPVDILLIFKPGTSGKPPNMTSLNVRLIGFIDIDITDRVLEYVHQSKLDISDTNLPVGEHEIGVYIKDVDGNPNERVISVNVIP